MVPKGWSLGDFHSFKVSTIDGDRGKNYPKKEDYLTSGYALFLGADNIADGSLNSGKGIYISKEKHDSMRKGIVRDNDILLVMRGNGTGRSCIYTNKIKSAAARINSGLVIIRHDAEYTNVEYLHQLLQSPVIQKQFESFMFGSAQPQLTIQLLKKLKFLAPLLPEQRKIAQILSTWDKAITTTERLLTNRQQQKKALMQRLLTGKQRFAGFEGGWRNVFLADVATINKGKALSSKDLVDGVYPVFAGGKTSPYNHHLFTHENVITVSASGAYAGYVAFHNYKIWASDCSVIQSKKGNDIQFIFQFLLLMQSTIYSLQSGGAQPHIYPKDLDVLKISIPRIDEQQKIASVLSAADAEITTIQNQLNNLKQQKKALMQQLLTGKRRVKVDSPALATQ